MENSADQQLSEADDKPVEEAKKELGKAEAKLKEADAKLDKAKEEPKKELDKAKKELKEAEEKLDKAKKELKEAKKELKEAKKELQEAEEKLKENPNNKTLQTLFDLVLVSFQDATRNVTAATENVATATAGVTRTEGYAQKCQEVVSNLMDKGSAGTSQNQGRSQITDNTALWVRGLFSNDVPNSVWEGDTSAIKLAVNRKVIFPFVTKPPVNCKDIAQPVGDGLDVPMMLAIAVEALFNRHCGTGDLNESAYIGSLDSVVRSFFDLAAEYMEDSPGLHMDRDSSTHDCGSSTSGVVASLRPDFLVYLNSRLVFKGEEKKGGDGNLREAVDDLKKKTPRWNSRVFGTSKFLLCYASAGYNIVFVALVPNTNGEVEAYEISREFDLAKPRNRLLAAGLALNCFHIVTEQYRRCYNRSTICLYSVLEKGRRNFGSLTFCVDKVVKNIFVEESRVELIKKAYDTLQNSGFGLSVLEWKVSNKRRVGSLRAITMHLGPLCDEFQPTEFTMRLNAIQCVLNAGSSLHKQNICHNDIRWKNVLFCRDDLWYLIDPDECGLIDPNGGDVASNEGRKKDANDIAQLMIGWEGEAFEQIRAALRDNATLDMAISVVEGLRNACK